MFIAAIGQWQTQPMIVLCVCFWVKAGETALDQARENDNPEVALLLTKAPQVRKHTHL